MNRKILVLLLLATMLLFESGSAKAQETDEATVSAEKIQQSLQERIRKAIEENLTAGEETPVKARLKAFIGQVDSIAEETLSVLVQSNSSQQTSKQVITNADTVIVRSNKGKIKLSDISLQDQVIAMGLTGDNQTMTALRVVIQPAPIPPTSSTAVVVGQIKSLNPKTRHLALETSGLLQDADIIISRLAQLKTYDLKPVSLTELAEGQSIAAIIEMDTEDETNVLTHLVIFPVTATPTVTLQSGTCGDNVCQNIVCSGIGCPTPETAESCPADCGKK